MLERSGDYDDDEAAIESVSALCDRCGERVLLSDLYRTEQGDDVCSDCYADADKFEDESESESEDTGKAGDLFSAAAEVSVTESGIESGIESVTSIACGDSAGCSARIASLFPAVV
jgi:hypothetical protein